MIRKEDIEIFKNTLVKSQKLREELVKQNDLYRMINGKEKNYTELQIKSNLYLANLYVEIFDSFDEIKSRIKKPATLNLMTFSQYIKEVTYIKMENI